MGFVIGRIIGSFFSIWLQILYLVFLNSILLFKILFLWLSVSFVASYLFFTVTHGSYVIEVRRRLAILLTENIGYGLAGATACIALYEFVLSMVANSRAFVQIHPQLLALDLLHIGWFFQILTGFSFLIASYLSYERITEELFHEWHSQYSMVLYGIYNIFISGLCFTFLHMVGYV